MISNSKIEIARNNWLRASKELNFKLVMPYEIKLNGRNEIVFAFLPEYGSKNGTLVCLTSPPNFETNSDIVKWAEGNSVFYSFINVESFQSYSEDDFLEVLEDWQKIL